MLKRILVLILAVLFSATLWGCGSNRDSKGSVTDGGELGSDKDTGVAFVGATTCLGCHETFSWSAELVADYLAGKHVVNFAGAFYGYDYIRDNGCDQCHDPVGDSPSMTELLDSGELVTVGCENCHGAGGEHFGIGPMPVAKPGVEECGQCHEALDEDHLEHHPEANNITSNFKASRHFTASVRNEAVCSRCHTDEGGKLYKDVTTRDQLLGSVLPVASDEPIQCRTCHNPHKAGGLLFEDVVDDDELIASGQYVTCVSCHMPVDAAVVASEEIDDEGNLLPDYDRTELMFHETVYYRVLTDTHADDPSTDDVIEGYVVDPKSDRACLACHNVHTVEEIRADDDSSRFSSTINDQWSKSGHGGFIGAVKLAVAEYYDDDLDQNRTIEQMIAIKQSGVADIEDSVPDPEEGLVGAPAWVHYNWDKTEDTVPGDFSGRGSCQRCHTATGAKNFLNDPEAYDPADNDFSYLEGWTASTGSTQNEMLYCWACHSNNAGGLRNPGAITEEYDPAVVVSYPDVAGSNICMSCHLGRETGAVIKTKSGFDDIGFVNSHYLAAGGQLFAETGYEYAGRNYNNVSYYLHDQIGTPDQPGTGENGPCVGCHMSAEQSHLFLPVEKDHDTGEILAVTTTVCSNCHTPTPAQLNSWEEEYLASLEILKIALQEKGIFFLPSYPYFFADANGDGIVPTPDFTFDHDDDPLTDEIAEDNRSNGVRDWTVGGAMDGMDVMGAAFNFNLLEHDPGGYAHNQYYVKGLIWDSIDYMYDGILNDDVPEAIADLAPDAETQSAASEYLDGSRPGDDSRPPL